MTETRTRMSMLPANAGRIVQHWRRATPGREALRYGERSWTWAELADRVDRNVGAQLAAGLRAGDRVAVLDKNSQVQLETALACLRLGTVFVPINFLLPVDQACYLADNARVRLLLVGTEFRPVADAIAAHVPYLARVIVIGENPAEDPYTDRYEQWIANAEPAPWLSRPAADTCFAQLYTSGTTGFPKGAMLSGEAMTAHAAATGPALGLDADTVYLCGFGMYHAAALATEIAALYHGGCVVVTRDSDPKALLAEIVRQRVTHALVVPSTLAGFLEIPDVADLDYRHLRTLAYGATPIAPSLLRRCLDTFPVELAQGYGMTEACAAICVLPDADHRDPAHPERLASVGKPVAGMEIQIADLATGKPLAPGETGEVRLRSAQLMLGYWDGHRPDTTAFTADGWLCTGDAGYVDEDGYVYLSGRLKDMYLNDGWNVYAAVVERVLAAHPAVAEAAVIGVPHDTWGEVGMAFLIPAGPESGTTIDEADVLRHCREHLAEYEVPQTLVFVSEFERNALGKVVKDELRALARCQKSR